MRFNEGGASATPTRNEGIFFIADPPAGTTFQPVKRVPREKFGVVGHFPAQKKDLDALAYPDATDAEKDAIVEGMQFFTAPHAGSEGAGPMANQPFCLGCHMSQLDTVPERAVAARLGIRVAIVGDSKDHSTRELLDSIRKARHA